VSHAKHQAEFLGAIDPKDLKYYLKARGWTFLEALPASQPGSVWILALHGEEFELLVPDTKRVADYHRRVLDMLQTLEVTEERPQAQILTDMSLSQCDVVRVRADLGDVEAGSIPLQAGGRLVEKARVLMMAAACSAILARPVHPSRKNVRVTEYARKLRLGQSERGSYVITVISRLPDPPPQQALMSVLEEEPFARQVTRGLADGLRSIRSAASSPTPGTFSAAVEDGASANMCEAIADMGAPGLRELGFQFSWSSSVPLDGPPPEQVLFPADSIEAVREGGRLLRKLDPVEEFPIAGRVVRLHRGATADRGKITVQAKIESQHRHVTMSLDGDDYQLAITAHGTREYFSAVGKLVKRGRSWTLQDPRDLEIVPHYAP